jgi:thiol-disulfide isomerase/thioredoxin
MKSRFAIAAFTVGILAAGAALAGERPGPGDVPPKWLGLDRDGAAVEISPQAGKVQIVTFWASWCGPCKKELPMLEGIQRVAKDRVRVVAVNIEDRNQFRRLAKGLESLTLTITNDPGKAAYADYGVDGIPHMVIVGRDGRIVAVHRGYSEDGIDEILAQLNAELAKN